jgi:hypothetical protein
MLVSIIRRRGGGSSGRCRFVVAGAGDGGEPSVGFSGGQGRRAPLGCVRRAPKSRSHEKPRRAGLQQCPARNLERSDEAWSPNDREGSIGVERQVRSLLLNRTNPRPQWTAHGSLRPAPERRSSPPAERGFDGRSRSLLLKERGDAPNALRHRLPKPRAKERHDHAHRSMGACVDGQPEARCGATVLGDELGPLVEPERPEAHVPCCAPIRLIIDDGGGSLHATASLPTHDAGGGPYTYRPRRCLAHLKQGRVPPGVVLEVVPRDEVEHDLGRTLHDPLDGHHGHGTPPRRRLGPKLFSLP